LNNATKEIIISPFYPNPPYSYIKAEICSVMFFIEKERIEHLVPDFLKIARTPLVNLFIANYHESTLGPYHEAMVLIQATYKDADGKKTDGFYCPFIFVDSDAALACGREIWGFPKRLANITLDYNPEIVKGTVQRKGITLLEVTVSPKTSAPDFPSATILTLKQIPHAEGPLITAGANFAIQELIKTDFKITPHIVSTGPPTINYKESKEDPLYLLTPKSLIQGTYLIADMIIFYGVLLKKFV
jgi:acetoacetate decarboxylase